MKINILVRHDDGEILIDEHHESFDSAVERLQAIQYEHEANQDYLTDGNDE